MPSRRFAAKYGAIRFLSCPGRAETVSKFPAVSGNAWRTPSPSPPKSAKVKLRVRFKTSSGVTEFSEHEADGGQFQEREGVAVEIFPVLGETAATVEPRNRAFDDPTLG